MRPSEIDPHTLARASYAVLRRGGTAPSPAAAQLGLAPGLAERLERLFRARCGGGPEQPRFARHGAHVAAVLAAGGFPAAPDRCR